MNSTKIRVFVVDDHEMVRTGLRGALESAGDMECAGESATFEEALSAIEATRPDVAMLDIRLPDGDGIQLCRDIQARNPGIRCVMLTSFGGDEAVYEAIVAGAAGYLLKGMKVQDLLEAVRKVAQGQSLLDPAVTQKVLERLRRKPAEDDVPPLTAQEERILDGILEGHTNREIAASLDLAEQTVKNHVSSLLGKLGVQSRTQAAVYAAKRRGIARD